MSHVLDIAGLVKTFGGLTATDHVSLTVGTGEIHALIGPNGAGKSTLINQICGEILPNAGHIHLAGRDVTRLPPSDRVAQGLGRTFQITSLLDDMTVRQNLGLAIQAREGGNFRIFDRAARRAEVWDEVDEVLKGQALGARADIALANQIAHEVLGRTLDEMPPQTRRLLILIYEMVQRLAQEQGLPLADVRFTRRDIREATQWSDGQLKIHCTRLTEMEYLMTHGGSRGHHLQYELLYDGKDAGRHLCGLLDPAKLVDAYVYDERKLGLEDGKLGQGFRKSVPSQPQVSPKLGPTQGAENAHSPCEESEKNGKTPKTQFLEKNSQNRSVGIELKS